MNFHLITIEVSRTSRWNRYLFVVVGEVCRYLSTVVGEVGKYLLMVVGVVGTYWLYKE